MSASNRCARHLVLAAKRMTKWLHGKTFFRGFKTGGVRIAWRQFVKVTDIPFDICIIGATRARIYYLTTINTLIYFLDPD